jgi:hypothetical protein
MANQTFMEEIQITGDKLIETIKGLLHEGNVRHIVIQNPEGETILEVPVSVGVVGLLIAPVLAAVGAIAVFAANFKILVTREVPPTE